MTEHDDAVPHESAEAPGPAGGDEPTRASQEPPPEPQPAQPPQQPAPPSDAGGAAAAWPPGAGAVPPPGTGAIPPPGWPPGPPMPPGPPVPPGSMPPGPDPFVTPPRRPRVRWINPRRRVATWLVAAGIAVVFFGGGIGAGIGIANHGPGLVVHQRFGPGFGFITPGQGQQFGPLQRGGTAERPGRQGRQRSGPSASTSPSPTTGASPSTGATS